MIRKELKITMLSLCVWPQTMPNQQILKPSVEPQQYEWYAMRASYSQELKAKDILTSLNVESFVPMQLKLIMVKGKKIQRLVPIIHNLIFIRASSEQISDVKEKISFLRYIMDSQHNKIVVPEYQMQEFIKVSSTQDESLQYFSINEIDLEKGTRVRVHGGLFDGVEGVFLKVEGRRDKHLVVAIDGLIAASVRVKPDLIEKI